MSRRPLAATLLIALTLAATTLATAQAPPVHTAHRLAIPGLAFDGAYRPEEDELNAAEARWSRMNLDSYRQTVTIGRFGPSERHTIEVRDGVTVRVESDCRLGDQPTPCLGSDPATRYSIPGLFALIRAKLAEPVYVPDPDQPIGRPYVNATYDPATGRPTAVSWGLTGVPDSGEFLSVVDFEVLPGNDPVPPTP